MKKIVLIFISLFIICACGKNENPIVTMEIKDYGTIKMELYPKIAPNTVANFVNLVQDGFYDNNTFHRLVKGFVLQGGDPTGKGDGGPGYYIKGEFRENKFTNTLSHTKGIVSMARATRYDTAGSQFFIVLDDTAAASLDGKYAAFGEIIEGMKIIEKIAQDEKVKDEVYGLLENNLTITKATVKTYGKKYKVEKIDIDEYNKKIIQE